MLSCAAAEAHRRGSGKVSTEAVAVAAATAAAAAADLGVDAAETAAAVAAATAAAAAAGLGLDAAETAVAVTAAAAAVLTAVAAAEGRRRPSVLRETLLLRRQSEAGEPHAVAGAAAAGGDSGGGGGSGGVGGSGVVARDQLSAQRHAAELALAAETAERMSASAAAADNLQVVEKIDFESIEYKKERQALRRHPKVQAQVRILWDTAETKVFRMGRDEVLLPLPCSLH